MINIVPANVDPHNIEMKPNQGKGPSSQTNDMGHLTELTLASLQWAPSLKSFSLTLASPSLIESSPPGLYSDNKYHLQFK